MTQLFATRLNNAGAVVGVAFIQALVKRQIVRTERPLVWQREPATAAWTVAVLPAPSGAGASAYALNDNGQIAGNAGGKAIRWTPSGAGYTYVISTVSQAMLSSIDRCGRVIGATSDSRKTKGQPWIWDTDGSVTWLPLLSGRVGGQAQDIIEADAASMIVGNGYPRASSPRHGLRWSMPGCP